MAPDTADSARHSPPIRAEEWRLATLVHSAIAGVSLAATVELATVQSPSTWLLAASILFALALPAAVSSVVILMYFEPRNKSRPTEALRKGSIGSGISSFLALMSQLAGFGGVLMLFWQLHWVAGVVFLAVSLLAVVTLATLGRK
jgi:uncharacterized membrane protein YesL